MAANKGGHNSVPNRTKCIRDMSLRSGASSAKLQHQSFWGIPMKHTALLLAAAMLLATTIPGFAAGTTDTDTLTKNSPNTPEASSSAPEDTTASSAPHDDSSSAPNDTNIQNTPPPDASLVSARDPQSVLTALSNLGYPGKMDKMSSGRASIAVTVSGLKTYIDFYDCADDLTDCYTLLFNVSLDLKT